MNFTVILLVAALLNFCWDVYSIMSVPVELLSKADFTPVRRSMYITMGLLLWAAYRAWG